MRDLLKAKLGKRATVTQITQVGDHISIEVFSQNDYKWTSEALEEVAVEIVEVTNLTIDVSLGESGYQKLSATELCT